MNIIPLLFMLPAIYGNAELSNNAMEVIQSYDLHGIEKIRFIQSDECHAQYFCHSRATYIYVCEMEDVNYWLDFVLLHEYHHAMTDCKDTEKEANTFAYQRADELNNATIRYMEG